MAVRTGSLSAPTRTATVVAATLVLASVALGVLTQTEARHHDRSLDRRRSAADAGRFAAEVRGVLAETDVLAAIASDPDPAAFEARAADTVQGDLVGAVALATTTDDAIVVLRADRTFETLAVGGPLRAEPRLSAAIDSALVSTTTQLAAPVPLPGGPAIVAVAPVYPPGTPRDRTSRRPAATEVVATLTSLAALRFPDDGPPLWPGAAVRITTPDGSFGDRVADPVLETEMRAGDEVWGLEIGALPGDAPIIGWIVMLSGVAAAITAYVLLRRNAVIRARASFETAVRSRQLEMIASTSAALQQSLDLADLLPSFCVAVAGEFRVGCIAVLVADDDGRLVEVFRYGNDDGGEQIDLELRRGWRAVGRLVAHADEPLDEPAGQSLQALADLLAVAISNAHLFQREQQAATRLRELDTLKNAFLGTVSHELRTSTTAVQGFGELLTEHWETLGEERRRELAARIRRQAGSLRHLVDDLLDYARLEHSSLRVSARPLHLGDLVRQLADSMTPLVASHEVVIEIEDGVEAWADPIAVERILANLLSNAGKYSPSGTPVVVRVERVGDRARLSVADRGPGIPLEERRRVFVRFYRLSNPETVRTRGAGIGLSILHDFAERSGATVTIDDAPGGGALIMVDFPTEPIAGHIVTEDELTSDATPAGGR